jgi:hypothetical protein
MYLVRLDHRTVNLEFLIEAADSVLELEPKEVPKGKIRVSLYPGRIFDVGGDAAASLRLHLDDLLVPSPQRAKAKGAASRVVPSPEKSR